MEARASVTRCPECGWEIDPEDEMCPNCGAYLADYEDVEPSEG
ncbi:MAG: zinc-ribbon domain-containing protein [Methanobacteriota archaeon]|nr:MAG: zinc-ribbon domain-containing protein [Euryarchaeota archaeon]